MKILKNIFTAVFTLTLLFTPLTLSAQGLDDGTTACGLLGCGNLGIDPSRFDNLNVIQIASLIAGLIFVGIIALGIFYIIKGALKIIRSEGDPTKVEEGSKIFRGVFIGILMILGGILGLALVIAIFNAGGITNVNPELPPTN